MISLKLKKIFSIALAGFLASLVIFLMIYLGIHITNLAPFNVPPSAAFLYNLGIEGDSYALLLHFCYGILWSFVFVGAFEDDVSVPKALGLSIILWIFMMVIYSPLIGWGIFGLGYANNLAPSHPLYLEEAFSYMIITLLVHLAYGWILGYLNCKWIGTKLTNR